MGYLYESLYQDGFGACYPPRMRDQARQLATCLRDLGDGNLLVITGAGISHASGIPTFRGTDPDAIWKQRDMALATAESFQRDPVSQWQWYLARFRAVRDARPNPAHLTLVHLERWLERRGGTLQLVTQNIDTLHEVAGSRNLIKVHGTCDRVRCSRIGCELGAPQGSLPMAEVSFNAFLEAPSRDSLPGCPRCGALLRAHVLFFDEYYLGHEDYRFVEVEAAAERADLMLFVGTSFSVGVTDLFLRRGMQRHVPMISIDPTPAAPRWPGLDVFASPAEELLPKTFELVSAAISPTMPES